MNWYRTNKLEALTFLPPGPLRSLYDKHRLLPHFVEVVYPTKGLISATIYPLLYAIIIITESQYSIFIENYSRILDFAKSALFRWHFSLLANAFAPRICPGLKSILLTT